MHIGRGLAKASILHPCSRHVSLVADREDFVGKKVVLLEQVARQDAHMQKASKLPPPQHHPLGKEKTKGTSTLVASGLIPAIWLHTMTQTS